MGQCDRECDQKTCGVDRRSVVAVHARLQELPYNSHFSTIALKASMSRVTSSISKVAPSAPDAWSSSRRCLKASPYFCSLPRNAGRGDPGSFSTMAQVDSRSCSAMARVDPGSFSTTGSIICSSSSLTRSAALLHHHEAVFESATFETYSMSFDS